MVVDLFFHTARIIGADEKILLEGDRNSPDGGRAVGGVVLNHLGWARVLGLKTGIFGKIGDDANGAFLRAGMEELGIEHHLTLDGSASSFAPIFVDRHGNRAIYMARGATAELKPAEIRQRHTSFIRRGRIVTTEISQLPLPAVIEILQLARKFAIPAVLDVDVPLAEACPNLGSPAQLERALKLATILKPSKAAARALAGNHSRDLLQMAQAIRIRYSSIAAVITDGANGCAIAARDGSVRVPAFRVKQIDSTGAGDAFLGAMLAGLRWGLDWKTIGRLANAAGAVCVTMLGAFPPGFAVRDKIFKLHGHALPSMACWQC
jgi:ribokinase